MTAADDAPAPAFLGLEPPDSDLATAAAVVLPVPYDGTSTWRKGADRGPRAILDASTAVEWYDIETGTEVHRRGIATETPVTWAGTPEGLADAVDRRVDAILERDQLPVVLGGEHSVAIGAIRAAARRFPGLTVLQLDAHADTRERYEGSTHNHACVMARVREWCPIVQVGLRSVDASELPALVPERVFWAHEMARTGSRDWMDRAVGLLADPVWVTIDLDVFDPAYLPATGTPEPGGLDWWTVTQLLGRVAARRRVVGFDLVELLPLAEHHASDFLAAKLAHRLLSAIFAGR